MPTRNASSSSQSLQSDMGFAARESAFNNDLKTNTELRESLAKVLDKPEAKKEFKTPRGVLMSLELQAIDDARQQILFNYPESSDAEAHLATYVRTGQVIPIEYTWKTTPTRGVTAYHYVAADAQVVGGTITDPKVKILPKSIRSV